MPGLTYVYALSEESKWCAEPALTDVQSRTLSSVLLILGLEMNRHQMKDSEPEPRYIFHRDRGAYAPSCIKSPRANDTNRLTSKLSLSCLICERRQIRDSFDWYKLIHKLIQLLRYVCKHSRSFLPHPHPHPQPDTRRDLSSHLYLYTIYIICCFITIIIIIINKSQVINNLLLIKKVFINKILSNKFKIFTSADKHAMVI